MIFEIIIPLILLNFQALSASCITYLFKSYPHNSMRMIEEISIVTNPDLLSETYIPPDIPASNRK